MALWLEFGICESNSTEKVVATYEELILIYNDLTSFSSSDCLEKEYLDYPL